MDKNTLIGVSLMMMLMMGYFYFTKTPEAELARQKSYSDSMALVSDKADTLFAANQNTVVNQKETLDTAINQKTFETMGKMGSNIGQEQFSTLSNNNYTITFSSKGGRMAKVKLNNFKRADSTELILFENQQHRWNYQFIADGYAVNTALLNWRLGEKTTNSINYYLDYDSQSYIKQTYTLVADTFRVDYDLQLVGMNNKISTNKSLLTLEWALDAPQQEFDIKAEEQKSTLYYKFIGETPDYISEAKYKSEKLEGKTEWVSFKQQFFNATLISKDKPFEPESKVETKQSKNDSIVKYFSANLDLAYSQLVNEDWKMSFYLGPNHVPSLKKVGYQLDNLVPLGFSLFRWINEYIIIKLFNALRNLTSNYGLVIFLLTLIIKLVLLPLTYKSYKSGAKMKVLKPEIDAIKAKNEGNMQKTQIETMALYKKVGVSPLGGCLPMVLQMPILMSIFFFFPSSFELRQQSFAWAADLSRFDSVLDLNFNIPFYGNHVSLFTLLMTISTFLYTYMNNQITGVSGQMKYIGYIMPVFFLGFFNNYAAGLTYYYFLSNMITFTQQWAIRRFFVDENKILAQMAAFKEKKGKDKKPSMFQQKLEEMARKRGIDPKTGQRKK